MVYFKQVIHSGGMLDEKTRPTKIIWWRWKIEKKSFYECCQFQNRFFKVQMISYDMRKSNIFLCLFEIKKCFCFKSNHVFPKLEMSSFHRSSIPVKNLHKPFSSFIISGFWLTLRGNKISETSETGIIISRQRYKKENVNFHFKSGLCSSVQFTADVESFFTLQTKIGNLKNCRLIFIGFVCWNEKVIVQ